MTAMIAMAAVAVAQGSQSIDGYVQKNFNDASFTARVKKANQRELVKVNDDFGSSYRFKTTNFKVKEPFKIRAEANVEDNHIVYVLNGASLLIKVPRAKINSRQNLANSPGRRQTVLDFGLLTPSLFNGFFDAKFVRMDRATNDAVFDITYEKKFDDTSRHRVWIDPARKFVTKREWYSQPGRHLATFYYSNPVQIDGVWMPTAVQVRNADNVVAGETVYENLKINSGIADSFFQTQ